MVGVGSVGMRAWILLFQTGDESEGLMLQAKQAVRSVIAEFTDEPDELSGGARVVAGQRLMQATGDIFLGWVSSAAAIEPAMGAHDYYLRQLRDWKLSVDIDTLTPRMMELYAHMCGWTLARAHARSGDRIAIAGYLGSSSRFDDAIAEFAVAYADRNATTPLQAAVAVGGLTAAPGSEDVDERSPCLISGRRRGRWMWRRRRSRRRCCRS